MQTPSDIQSAPLNIIDPFDDTPYRMIRPLARGGMGQLYLIEHRERSGEWVAKLIHERLASEPQLIARARIEAESLRNLIHPNIVAVCDVCTTRDGRPFIVMEYLRGSDLAAALASGRSFTPMESVELVGQAASALCAAHEMGIIHRDIKPENLFLQEHADGSEVLKVLDFGVARVVPGASPVTPEPLDQPTAAGVIVGTLRYASPESLAGTRVDYRADIYGLGLVLYRMIAGRSPWGEQRSESAVVKATLTEEPQPPSAYTRGGIPPELDEVILKALKKAPEERYPTMQDFGEALTRVKDFLVTSSDNSKEAAFAPLQITAEPATFSRARPQYYWPKGATTACLFGLVLFVTAMLMGFLVARLRQSVRQGATDQGSVLDGGRQERVACRAVQVRLAIINGGHRFARPPMGLFTEGIKDDSGGS